jgi:hypothetical protein
VSDHRSAAIAGTLYSYSVPLSWDIFVSLRYKNEIHKLALGSPAARIPFLNTLFLVAELKIHVLIHEANWSGVAMCKCEQYSCHLANSATRIIRHRVIQDSGRIFRVGVGLYCCQNDFRD